MIYLCIVDSNNYYSSIQWTLKWVKLLQAAGLHYSLYMSLVRNLARSLDPVAPTLSAHLWPRNSALYSGSAKQLIPTPNPSLAKTSSKVFHKSSSATKSSWFLDMHYLFASKISEFPKLPVFACPVTKRPTKNSGTPQDSMQSNRKVLQTRQYCRFVRHPEKKSKAWTSNTAPRLQGKTCEPRNCEGIRRMPLCSRQSLMLSDGKSYMFVMRHVRWCNSFNILSLCIIKNISESSNSLC